MSDSRRVSLLLFLALQGCLPWFSSDVSEAPSPKLADMRQKCPDEVFKGQPLLRGSALCEVNALLQIGEIGEWTIHAGLYRLLKPEDLELSTVADHAPLNNTAVAVFEERNGNARVVWSGVSEGVLGSDWFESPRLIQLPDGSGVLIPHRYSGSGFVNADRFLALRNGAWKEIDTSSWLGDLRAKLPTGLEILKGVELDLEKMTAHSALWRKEDANCCPSGGNVEVALTLRDLQLEISSINLEGPRAP